MKKQMKIAITDEGHSAQVQVALFKNGYLWRGTSGTVDNTDAKYLFAEDKYITYEWDSKTYFDEHSYEEHWLVNGEFVDSSYWTQPVTKVPPDKHYAPLPLQPREQHEADRLRELLAHINYAAENGNDPASEITLEYHDLIVFSTARSMANQ